MDTLAAYVIDRSSFISMLGDCYEIAMRAANGQTIGELDEVGNIISWEKADAKQRMKDVEFVFNKAAINAIQLLANGRAVEDLLGEDYFEGEKFSDYIARFEVFYKQFMDEFAAAKVAVEYELGVDTDKE